MCTYFYNDLYKFLYHMFILFSSFPVYQYITDITKFIQQVGHFTYDEYVKSMKIAFFHFYKSKKILIPINIQYFNSQFSSKCLEKDEIVDIMEIYITDLKKDETVNKILLA